MEMPVTADAQKLCCACRSPESLRDVRGFSVKFYTEEGNWDFVGNDIPVRSNPPDSECMHRVLLTHLPDGFYLLHLKPRFQLTRTWV